MQSFKLLKLLRKQYPLTTASAHNLVMRASELKQARLHQTWIELHGSNREQLAFESALHDTLTWAAYEAHARNEEELLNIFANFMALFLHACPSWKNVRHEIIDYLKNASTKDVSALLDAIERVQCERSALKRHGVTMSLNRFWVDQF